MYLKVSFTIVLLNTVLITASQLQSLLHRKQVNVSCDCIEAQKCKGWLAAVRSGKYLDLPICGFNSISLNPLLCCPHEDGAWKRSDRTRREIQNLEGLSNVQLSCKITSTKASSPIQIAKQKCAEYAKSIFQSLFEVSVGDEPFQKQKVDTCVKGSDEEGAKSREFPHMALIGYGENKKWLCGGSLISERFVLGVAHCANPSGSQGPAKWVKLGELDTSTDTDIARPQVYKIIERIIHPDYKLPTMYNDIALYKLEKEIEFTIYVRPACLFTKRDPPDSFMDGTGWGKSPNGNYSSYLKKIKMELVSHDDCSAAYNKTGVERLLPQGLKNDLMVCAIETNSGGKKLCQGDSGGPLQINLKTPYCMKGLIGLVSFGQKCDVDAPGINTRISHYVPWIVENVWPDEE